VLLGRDAERARIHRLLECAQEGAGGGLVVLGPPGIGKTAVLDAAGADATGFRVLRATGVEVETELAFSGLYQLLRPVAVDLTRLPPRQATALRAAFAEAGATGSDEADGADGFAVAAAALTLLAWISAAEPVLCLVDDTQWLDVASVAALAFAVRRIESERVAMVFAARGPLPGLRGIPVVELAGLADDPARDVLTAAAGEPPSAAVATALLRASSGNPLVLRELAGALGVAELIGAAELPDPLPAGPELSALYRSELQALPAPARAALLVLAVSESDAPEQVLPAVGALTGDPAALDPAERAGLVRSSGSSDAGLRFRHPLLRSVVHHDATTAERQAAHRALAETLPAGLPERRAWHRALSTVQPDEAVAAELSRTATVASRRGGRWAECRAYELAARLSPDREARAQRTHRAAVAAFLAGRHGRASEHLETVLAVSEDPLLRADAEHERARIALWRGSPDPPILLETAAERVASYDAERAAKLYAYAVVGLGAQCRAADAKRYALRAWELIGGRADPLVVGFKVAYTLVMAGDTGRGEPLTITAAARAEDGGDTTALAMLGPVLGWLDRAEDAERVLSRAVEQCRFAGDVWMLVNALTNAAEACRRRARLEQALIRADEARALAEQLDEPVQLTTALAVLARVEADLGRGVQCRAHAEQVLRSTEPEPTVELRVVCAAALGGLAVASRRYEDAIDQLAPVAALLAAGGVSEPRVFGVQADLAEAYLRCGRTAEAEPVVAGLEEYASLRRATSVLAAVARCRGLVEEDFEPLLTDAAGLYRGVDAPLEEARSLLYLGERLRRQGRRAAAREPLRTSLEICEQRGASVWADRARDELRATGETLQPHTDDPRLRLTTQELQIARLVADGARNRDVAASLFLSPKTVEAHLTRAYRKLGVTTRTQLAARLNQAGSLQGMP